MKRLNYCMILVILMAISAKSQDSNETLKSPIQKWAEILVHYSLDLQPGEKFAIHTTPEGKELALKVYKEALKIGSYPVILVTFGEEAELFFKYASDKVIQTPNPINVIMTDSFDVALGIQAASNTKAIGTVDPERLRITREANKGLHDKFMKKWTSGEFRFCATSFPTHAQAQDAGVGYFEYRDFVFQACKLNHPNPSKVWMEEAKEQKRLAEWLKGKESVELKGPNIDMKMSIKDRVFIVADGKLNFPDGEIFTSPVENSANGWVKFTYPAIASGRELENIQLWFENGKVVKEKSDTHQDLLTANLDTDEGSRVLGELGIGTNYGITKYTKNTLFDEKIGGTIHLAVGMGFPDAGGNNESILHWDLVCDMSEGEILVDGELFYKNGKFVK